MASTADCWADFWESEDREGGYKRFNGPAEVSDLKQYEFDNGKEVEDDVDSLATGTSSWLVVFKDKNYEDTFLRVPPGSYYSNMDEFGLGDNIESFRLYDQQPTFWPSSDPDATGKCWLKFYRGRSYVGDVTRLNGPGLIPNTKFADIHDIVFSLSTGPDTWIELYTDYDFIGDALRFGPNTLVRDVTLYSIQFDIIRSIKIYSEEPDNWMGNSEPIPAAVLAIESANATKRINACVGAAVSTIPEFGAAISVLLKCFWPSPGNPMEIWNDLENYINQLVQDLINQQKIEDLQETLDGLYQLIENYQESEPGAEKGQLLTSLVTELITDEPFFVDPDDPASTITYLVAMGTITLLVLREQALFYTQITLQPTDPNAAKHLADLQEKIIEYTKYAQEARDGALEWRVDQIEITRDGSSFVVVDNYNSYQFYYQTELEAEEGKVKLKEQVGRDYQSQLDAYILPSTLWQYLNPDATTQPTRVTVEVASQVYGGEVGTPFEDDPQGQRITSVQIYAGDRLDGLQFYYGGVPGPLHGRQSGSTWLKIDLDDDEFIEAAYGGCGDSINQIRFRTNKGRDFGAGGGSGGTYVATAPQGVSASLTKIAGKAINDGVTALRFYWEYETLQ